MKIYLISTNYLKDNSTINLNVEDSLIKNAIQEGQKINIQQVLGTTLYEKILTLVEDDDIGDAGNEAYATLLTDYIQPSLMYWSLFHSLPFTNYKITNKNIGTQSSDNSTPVELNELKYLTALTKDKAEYYSELMRKYIVKNNTDYPEFCTSDNCGLIHPAGSSYNCGMVLD